MPRYRPESHALPLKGGCGPSYALSALVAVLIVAASLTGVIGREAVYPTVKLAHALLPNDVVSLCLGLPILLGAMWLTQRGNLVGLMLWPGALFFVLYTYSATVWAMPQSWLFLLHLALVVLSAYGLLVLTASLDAVGIARRIAGRVPERLCGGVLIALGALFFLRAIYVFVGTLLSGKPVPDTELGAIVADVITSPAWVIGGVLLWRRAALGYMAGLALLYQGSMLFIGLIAYMLIQPLMLGTAPQWLDIAIVLVMGLVCFVPFYLFLRGVVAAQAGD